MRRRIHADHAECSQDASLAARTLAVATVAAALLVAGCNSTPPRDTTPTPIVDTNRAKELVALARNIAGDDPEQAEALLRQATEADPYYAPALNNLGVLLLNRGELFEAATNLEEARRLSPGNPDPRFNLGLVLERAGRFDDAVDAYRSAIGAREDFMPAIQALARLQIRASRRDASTRALLEQIAIAGESDEWRRWARGELARTRE